MPIIITGRAALRCLRRPSGTHQLSHGQPQRRTTDRTLVAPTNRNNRTIDQIAGAAQRRAPELPAPAPALQPANRGAFMVKKAARKGATKRQRSATGANRGTGAAKKTAGKR